MTMAEVPAKNMRCVCVYELPQRDTHEEFCKRTDINKTRTGTTASSVTIQKSVGKRRVGCILRTVFETLKNAWRS